MVALLLSSSVTFAQTSFRPGYIVPLAGDTVRGTVQYQSGQGNGLRCRFQIAADQTVAEYQPEQLRGYGFTKGQDYQSQQLAGPAGRRVFVQAVVLGKASLYRFINEQDKDCYYVGTDAKAPLEALIQKDTLQANSNKDVYAKTLVRTYPFRNVLWKVMADCPSVQTTVARMELAENSLVRVFSAYNACMGGATNQYVAKKQVATVHFVVLGGASQSSMTYLDKGANGLQSAMRATGGIGLEILPTRFNPHFSVQLQALYGEHNSSQQFKNRGDGIYPNEKVRREVFVDMKTIRVPLMLRYSLLTKGIRPYVQVGGLAALNVRGAVLEAVSGGAANTDQANLTALPLYSVGMVGGAGVTLQVGPSKLLLEARFDRLVNTLDKLSNHHSFSLLAGYTFGR
ncbi:outer membrane beta-barrel protein [Hymenobacter cellulosivorans]|uniref:Outer membrane beta-barrel protein n=1 Tax=Hymenobacter cellulosivorans TaxID=2932249 RepID=A0ABY4FA57_9BACT|nr:outer membrane beta-barrel protein [Hymenobacter cellulosivorans]UOQ53556.1 outer membrane beta-barrel protein [Hymenobacter cellulosivorans]